MSPKDRVSIAKMSKSDKKIKIWTFLFAYIRKLYYLCSMKFLRNVTNGGKKKMENSVVNNVRRLIIKRGRATYWFVDDFVSCGNNASVKKALQQLTNEKMLIRISIGVYYYPKIDRELGLGVLMPSKENTALAIAKHAGLKVVPTGAFALNAFGLTTQMQTVVAFLTNGRAKQIDLGNGRYIKFFHSSSQRLFDYKSYRMILVIQAMTELGEAGMTEEVRSKLREQVAQVSERDFMHDIKLAPVWGQEVLRELKF